MIITIFDRYGNTKAEISPNDSSIQSKEIQADNILQLSFINYDHILLDVDDYVDFMGERYWLCEKYRPKQKSAHEWEYNLKLYGIESLLKNILVIKRVDNENNPVFTLTAPPREHVAMIVNCLNDGMGNITDWKVGQVDGTENIVIDYFGKYCDEALREIAEKVGAEYWTEGQTVNVCRCEHGEHIALGYDKGLTGIEPDTADNVKFYTRLYPVGSSRNIDPEKYGHSRLQLPDGKKYVEINADKYSRVDHYEESAFTDIYPRRIGKISSVRFEEKTGEDGNPFVIYYFRDENLPFDPNKYEIPGLVKRVSFQEGSELAGLGAEEDGTYYFEVNFNSDTREFEIITTWPYDDGNQLPGGNLIPKEGDNYILWHIRMPDEYYQLAEEEFQTAVDKYNEDHGLDITVFKASTDHVWIEDNNVDLFVGRRVRLESQKYFPETGYRDSRITKITRKINLPSSMDIEIGDALSRSSKQKFTDDIADAKSYAQSIGSSISMPDIIRTGDRTVPTDNNIFSARRILRDLLRKDQADRTPYQLASDLGFEVGKYLAGVSGGMFGIDSADKQSFVDVFKLFVRGKAYFETLTTIEAQTLAGKQYITPGGAIKCTKVEEIKDAQGNVTAYRCYFLSEQDGEKTETKIKAGDQAISEMFNAKTDTTNKLTNHRYWRYVEAVNNDEYTDEAGNHYGYIDLSATDCEAGSDIPKEGDVIDQLGSRNDATRQSAMVFSTVDPDSPSIKMFAGIGSGTTNAENYSLDGKAIISFGRNPSTGKVYFRLGATDASEYLEYTQDGGLMLNGKLSVNSTIGDKTLKNYFSDLIPDIPDAYDDTEIKEEINKYKYLAKALPQSTTIAGGLLLSTLVELGYTDASGVRHTMAGMNGSWVDSLGGRTIGSWWGGNMIDLFKADGTRKTLQEIIDETGDHNPRPATSLVRMDGSAYWANGNIRFLNNGTAEFGDTTNGYGITIDPLGKIIMGSGIEINIGGEAQGLADSIASVTNLVNLIGNNLVPTYLTQGGTFAETTWENILSKKHTLAAIKSKVGLFGNSFISSRGGESGGSGSGGGASYNRLDAWDKYTADKAGYVLSAFLGKDLDTRLSAIEGDYAKKSDIPSLARYVTTNTAQTISATKTFTAGLRVSGRAFGGGDDEGIVIGKADNGFAALTLGIHNGARSVFYLGPTNDAYWRWSDSTNLHDIYHPKKSGTIALTSDITASLGNYYTKTEADGRFMRYFWTVEPGYDCATHNDKSLVSFTYSNNAPFYGGFIDVNTDGYGFYLGTGYYSDGPLFFRRHGTQNDGGMGSWRTLLDNVNYASILDSRYLRHVALNGGLIPSTATTWGNSTGTQVAEWTDNSGNCAFKFMKDNPVSNRMSMLIDGTVYINEGQDAVASQTWVQTWFAPLTNLSNYLPRTGGTITGALELNSYVFFTNPTSRKGLYFTTSPDGHVNFYQHVNNTWTGDAFMFGNDGSFYAKSIARYGGTASQFLKADGSVDGNNYVPWSTQTVATVNGTNLNPQFINIESGELVSGYLNYWNVINLGSYSGGNFRSQIAMPYQDAITDTDMFIRTAEGSTWRAWRRVLHNGNYSAILDSRYVNKAGDTMSDALTINSSVSDTPLRLNGYGGGCYIQMKADGNTLGYYGATSSGPVWHKDGIGNKLWHSGNMGPGSNLNADLLDGEHLYNIAHRATDNLFDNNAGYLFIPCSSNELPSGYGTIFQWGCDPQVTPATQNTYNWYNQLYGTVDHRLYYRVRTNGGAWTGWRALAYLDDKVADADKLDGYHHSDFAHMDQVQGTSSDSNISLLKSAHSRFADSMGRAVRLERGSYSMAFGWFLGSYPLETAYGGWFISDYATPRWIGVSYGNWVDETFAFLSSNVASATRLQTSRTIWGQYFDGTGNVDNTLHLHHSGSGNYNEGIRLYGTTKDNSWSNIHFGCDPAATEGTHANQWILGRNSSNNFILDVNAAAGSIMTWFRSGNVSIGHAADTGYKLFVNGTMGVGHLYTSGYLLSNRSGQDLSVLDYHGDGSLALNYGLATVKGLPCTIYGNTVVKGDLYADGMMQSNASASDSARMRVNCGNTSILTMEANASGRGLYDTALQKYMWWFDGSNVFTNYDGNYGIGTTSPSEKLSVNGWVGTIGNTGWYSITHGGGWWMKDSTYIRNYNSRRLLIEGINDYYAVWLSSGGFCTEGYAGTSWNQGYGALNVGIANNDHQTPLLVAYRNGSALEHTGSDRLFSMEFHNSGWLLRLCFGGAEKFEFISNGVFHALGGIYAEGYISSRGRNSSDERLKTDIRDFRASDIIRTLHPRAFRWNDFARSMFPVFDTDDTQYGLIAQEAKVCHPWLVDENMFGDGYMGVFYDKLIPVLLQGENELFSVTDDHERRITDQETRIAELEAENRKLRNRIEILTA